MRTHCNPPFHGLLCERTFSHHYLQAYSWQECLPRGMMGLVSSSCLKHWLLLIVGAWFKTLNSSFLHSSSEFLEYVTTRLWREVVWADIKDRTNSQAVDLKEILSGMGRGVSSSTPNPAVVDAGELQGEGLNCPYTASPIGSIRDRGWG